MSRGKLIVIEGTDCSGKETQSNLLKEKLEGVGCLVYKDSFPMYDTPTGKIIGGPYLGKKHIGKGWFDEGASNVDPLVASAYFTADRKYNIDKINEKLDQGYTVILDRYVESNMAHQGGKIFNKVKREDLYWRLDLLEYEIFELPRPDRVFFLYMPQEYTEILKKGRKESADQHESDVKYLLNSEKAYLELATMYNFVTINCVENNQIKTIEEISDSLFGEVFKEIYKPTSKRL